MEPTAATAAHRSARSAQANATPGSGRIQQARRVQHGRGGGAVAASPVLLALKVHASTHSPARSQAHTCILPRLACRSCCAALLAVCAGAQLRVSTNCTQPTDCVWCCRPSGSFRRRPRCAPSPCASVCTVVGASACTLPLLSVACCMLSVACCRLHVAGHLFSVCRMLSVACCMLRGVCRMLPPGAHALGAGSHASTCQR